MINTLKHTTYLNPIEANKENSQYHFTKILQNHKYKHQAQLLESIAKQKLNEISNFNIKVPHKKKSLDECNPSCLNFQDLSAWQQSSDKKDAESIIINKRESKKPLSFKKREFRKFSFHTKNLSVKQDMKIQLNYDISKPMQEINGSIQINNIPIQNQEENFVQQEDKINPDNMNNVFINYTAQKEITPKNDQRKSKLKDVEIIKKKILDNLCRQTIINRSMNSFVDQNIHLFQEEINRSNSSFCNYNQNMMITCKNQATFYKNNPVKIKKLVQELKINPHSMVLKQKLNVSNIKKANLIKHTKTKKYDKKANIEAFSCQNPILKLLSDKYDSILKKSKER